MDSHRHVSSQEQLAEICRQTLANWPEARAAVLFGSRARSNSPSDHHPSSDWDVVVIVDGNKPAEWANPVREQADNVDAWTIGHEYLEAHASDLGRLPYAVARDGRLLAGDWTRPIQKEAALRSDDWQERMLNTVSLFTGAINYFNEIVREQSWVGAYGYCGLLLESSTDAAELLVKAIMERRGVRADYIHSIEELIQTFAQERPKEKDLAQRMKVLNGYSQQDHLARYGGVKVDPDRIRTTIVRLTELLDLWLDELAANPDNGTMKEEIPFLFTTAMNKLDKWKDALGHEPVSKTGADDRKRKAVEAVLAARGEIIRSVAEFGNRLHQLTQHSKPRSPEP